MEDVKDNKDDRKEIVDMEKLLCPSMMCADYGNLEKEMKALNEAGSDMYHCDIMDGNFVPTMTMGIKDVETVCKYTDKMVDVHLMIDDPLSKVDWFINAGVDLIYIHPESEKFVIKTLNYIREHNVAAGIAVSPGVSVSSIKEILNVCDYVMVITVNPGFAGQKFMEFTKDKIKELAELKEQYGYKLMIDGAYSPQVIKDCSLLGVDGFILGTSALFGKDKSYKELMAELREL